MKITTCNSLSDINDVRQFLLEMYRHHGYLYCWEPRRWEGNIFHRNHAELAQRRAELAQTVGILRDASGEILGVSIDEYPGGVFIQARREDLQTQRALIVWSLENSVAPDGKIEFWCHGDDSGRAEILREFGFKPTAERQNRRHQVIGEVKEPELPEGYTLRGFDGSLEDAQRVADLLNISFGRDFHSAEEYFNFSQLAPSYRAELEIFVAAADGSFASHAGFTAHLDESFVVVEPVCTHPDHQNKGLARAAIAEGLRRSKALGIKDAYIEAWYSNPVSNRAYELAGFEMQSEDYIWKRD